VISYANRLSATGIDRASTFALHEYHFGRRFQADADAAASAGVGLVAASRAILVEDEMAVARKPVGGRFFCIWNKAGSGGCRCIGGEERAGYLIVWNIFRMLDSVFITFADWSQSPEYINSPPLTASLDVVARKPD